MRPLRWIFGNRVAWRIFGRFVIATLIPVAVLGVLSLTEVRSMLEQRAADDLAADCRTVGRLLLDRLLTTADLLAQLPTLPADTDLHALKLDGARYESPERSVSFGAGASAATPPSRDDTKPLLAIEPTPAGPSIVLARVLPHGRAFGRVDLDYLRDVASLAGSRTGSCVFAGSLASEPLFCSGALEHARPPLDAVDGAASGTLHWSTDGEAWLGAYWELFTPSRFDAEPWFVLIATPRSVALQSLAAFDEIAPQALAISLLLTVLLAVMQIRRTFEPLNRLLAGTERIAARDFDSPIDARGTDEFAALGRALNAMAGRLGRQFGTLTTLAEIDRLILASRRLEPVFEAVLGLVQAHLGAADVGIVLVETDERRGARLYRRPAGAAAVATTRIERPEILLGALLAEPHARVLDAAAPEAAGVARLLAPPPGGRLVAVPVVREGTLRGALLAAFGGAAVGPPDLEPLRELAGRLAVAVTAGEREQQLYERAHFDPLTGMPNRELCRDRLQQALVHARREEHRVAVLFVDLDGFKNINDSLGHVAGDELLKETALRLVGAVRESDTVSRFGGDEYVILLPDVQGLLEVEAVVERVLASLQRPFTVRGREAFVTASIGVTMFPEDGASPDELLRKADTALYDAKAAGRSRCVFFTKEMDERVQERLLLGNDLRRALDRHELYLVYQPQVSLDGAHVESAEALLRWRHPTRGIVSPQLFVPILEETGLIEAVGSWVLETALRDFASWRSAGLPIPRIGVNVSAQQLLAPSFIEAVTACTRAAGVGHEHLELELTESTLVKDLLAADARLKDLAKLGVRIAVDDFGTGYSSLGYLNQLTFDALKIDRAFVVNLPAEKSLAIVKAIVAVAHALGKRVVAEGIETELQRFEVGRLGCDFAQGYLFSPPLEAGPFASWLEAFAARPDAPRRLAKR